MGPALLKAQSLHFLLSFPKAHGGKVQSSASLCYPLRISGKRRAILCSLALLKSYIRMLHAHLAHLALLLGTSSITPRNHLGFLSTEETDLGQCEWLGHSGSIWQHAHPAHRPEFQVCECLDLIHKDGRWAYVYIRVSESPT